MRTQTFTLPSSFATPAPADLLQRRCARGSHSVVGGDCPGCRRTHAGNSQRLPAGVTSSIRPLIHEALDSPGRPLDPEVRANIESRFAHEFSRVNLRPASAAGLHPRRAQEMRSEAHEQEAERLAHAAGRPAQDPVAARATERGSERCGAGCDFRQVRVHTGPSAARSAAAVGAEAYTVGRNIVFAPGRYSPHSQSGRQLLAHELAHVAQQNQAARAAVPVVQRRVSPDYAGIEHRLTYRILDWAITDREAREVLQMLDGLSGRDLADTVAAMDRDGLVERLLDNVSTADQERYPVLLARIGRHRSVKRSAERIIDRLSYGFFDWAITDDDAREALRALMGLEPQELRTVVAKMVNKGVFDRLMDNLPNEEHRRFAAFIARLRRIRDEFQSLVTAHVAFLRGQPGGAGRTVSTRVRETGYGGSRSTFNDLPLEQQRAWERRAAHVIADVIASVRGTDLEPIVARSQLIFDPVRAEKLSAYAFVEGSNKLYFGREWVTDAEEDVRNVWQSIAHELGGHEEFGSTWSWEIMRAALARLNPRERREALCAVNSVYSAYGYLETEIYAELRELPFRIPTSGGDRPESTAERPGDVRDKLTKIRDAFGPVVGRQIALRLYYRVMTDPRVADESKRLLYDEIQVVFHLFPIVEAVLP